jgi:hypothetical protein
MNEQARFERSEIVTDWFGYWPSLHDAEVLSADFQRAIDGSGPGLRVKVHAFEMTSEVTEKGYFKLVKHCIIEFRFERVSEVELRNFGHQNVIDGISLSFVATEDGSRRIAVEFEVLSEMELRFSCSNAVVVGSTAGIPSEGVYAREL